MKRNKINKKACSNCGLEAAVARKVCSGCDTPFITKRPTYYYQPKDANNENPTPSTSGAESTPLGSFTSEDGSRRRTERVKREKPHFYDASEFVNKYKKKNKDKTKTTATKQSKVITAQMKKKEKKRLKELKLRESLAEAEDEQLYESIMTPHKAEQMAIILEELNTKLMISAWKP